MLRSATFVLAGIGFLDELASGMPVVSAPALVSELFHTNTAFAVLLFVLPEIAAFFLEAPLLVAADRWPRRSTIAAALAAMSVTMLGCALAPNVIVFGVGWILYANASGVACSIAQAALVEASGGEEERAMARWTFAGMAGDLCVPAVVWAAASVFGWRGAFVCATVVLLLWAARVRSLDLPKSAAQPVDEAEEEPGPTKGFFPYVRDGLANKTLLAWLFAASLCGMMDEVLASFGALLIHARAVGDPDRAVTLALGAQSVGAMVGLVGTDRLLARGRWTSRTILAAACVGCALAHVAWVASGSWYLSLVGLFFVGFFVAPHYPITMALAYRAAPGQGGLVNAIGQLFAVIHITVPIALGLIADRLGLPAALGFLLLQPLGILGVTMVARSRPNARAPK